jgi:hypothetical protein
LACHVTLRKSFLVVQTRSHKLIYHKLNLILPPALFTEMTRRKWTTTNQEEWLKSHLGEFSDAQANKNTSKEFFPAIFKEWRNAWPTPDPTPEEITKAGNVEKGKQKKKAEEDAVR